MTQPQMTPRPDDPDPDAVRIEVLHHDGCPLAAGTRELVADCLRELGIAAPISVRLARHPSPTVLVNGVDVMGAPSASADACRLDIPTRDRLLAALRAATGQPQH